MIVGIVYRPLNQNIDEFLTKINESLCKIILGDFNINLRWPNTVSANALANAMQHARKDCKKITWLQYSNHFICSMHPLSVLFFLLTVLVFSEKCILEKVTMQRTPQFADFPLLSKEPS